MNEKEEMILNFMKDEDYVPMKAKEMAMVLNISKDRYNELIEVLNKLEANLKIVKNRKNRYRINDEKILEGIYRRNSKGFGFVKIDGEEDEIYISKQNSNKAFNGDKVIIKIIDEGNKNKSQEGKVIKIVEHAKNTVVGTFEFNKNFGFVVPDDKSFGTDIFISKSNMGKARNGHKVLVEITKYPEGNKHAEGKVLEVLGRPNEAGVDMLSLIKEYGLPSVFPEEVVNEAKSKGDKIDKNKINGRVDLRDKEIFTIDGEDAKDLDDAISLRRLKNGNYYLGVHIADVSYYVEEGSELDKEALARGTSIYLVDRVIPMLPHKLSNGICSLNPHVDRFAISCFMEITPQGEVVDHDIVESVINSTERMTYNNVNKILAGDKKLQEEYSHVCDLFFLMKELAEILQKTREDRGAIDFDTNEAKVLVDEKGKPTDVVLRQRGESNSIIESFMLVANETVAKHFKWLDLPFIYRVHENPKVDKLRKFSTISRTLGYTIKGSLEDIRSKELSKIVEASKGADEHVIISTLLLRCMAKARYDEQCLGHFGLSDEYYTHFTSPIRRYPDLMVHRLIRTYLFKKKLDQETLFHFASIMQNVADQASSLERKAIDIEREVDDMKMAEYMEDHIGETFEGIVSSITNFGMFVELPNTIEGLIRMEDLVDDFYYFDDINLQLIGKRTGRRFKMSDKVKIKVSAASKREKTIDFQIVGMKSNKKKKKTVIINKRRDRKPKQKFKRKRR